MTSKKYKTYLHILDILGLTKSNMRLLELSNPTRKQVIFIFSLFSEFTSTVSHRINFLLIK